MLRIIVTICMCVSIAFVSAQEQKVNLLLRKGETGKAIQLLENSNNLSIEYRLLLADLYRENFQYHKSLNVYNQLLTKAPDNKMALEGAAKTYVKIGDLKSGVDNYTKLFKGDTTNTKYAGNLAALLVKQKEVRKAKAVYATILRSDSLNAYFMREYAKTLSRTKKSKEAEAVLEKANMHYPKDKGVLTDLGTLYVGRKKNEKSDSIFKYAEKLYPNDISIYRKHARALFSMKYYPLAIKCYEKVVAMGDSSFFVKQYMGIANYHAEEFEKAIKHLKYCLSLNPMEPYVNLYLGLSHKGLKQYDEAIGFLEDALGSFMDGQTLGEVYHHLAIVYGYKRDFANSIECYEKAFEMNNRKSDVFYEIATTYEEFHKSKEKALQYYRKYLKLNAGKKSKKVDYALDRVHKIREDIFWGEK
ncbi:tetratricopeptide repeat protein [Prolixibacteraceae bacterium JC049]|nr:tetratricopeptide repeat protein [Prolixibacteraceae bacterium JC049]